MGGELSKNIGEDGERIVSRFFKLIGWETAITGENIACNLPHEHQLGEGPRGTHGIDAVFSYLCPLVPSVRRNVVVSIKNSFLEDIPPSNSKMASAIIECSRALRCFQRSRLKSNLNKAGGAQSARDHGLVIRLDKSPEEKPFRAFAGERRLTEPVGSTQIPLLETERFDFIDRAAKYMFNIHGANAEIHYPRSSSTASLMERKLSGHILPYHNLIGGPLTYQVPSGEGFRLVVISNENYSPSSLHRLIGLAIGLSEGFAAITLVFPDYVALRHENEARSLLMSLPAEQLSRLVDFDSIHTIERKR